MSKVACSDQQWPRGDQVSRITRPELTRTDQDSSEQMLKGDCGNIDEQWSSMANHRKGTANCSRQRTDAIAWSSMANHRKGKANCSQQRTDAIATRVTMATEPM
jgi:hypothetical protein